MGDNMDNRDIETKGSKFSDLIVFSETIFVVKSLKAVLFLTFKMLISFTTSLKTECLLLNTDRLYW